MSKMSKMAAVVHISFSSVTWNFWPMPPPLPIHKLTYIVAYIVHTYICEFQAVLAEIKKQNENRRKIRIAATRLSAHTPCSPSLSLCVWALCIAWFYDFINQNRKILIWLIYATQWGFPCRSSVRRSSSNLLNWQSGKGHTMFVCVCDWIGIRMHIVTEHPRERETKFP